MILIEKTAGIPNGNYLSKAITNYSNNLVEFFAELLKGGTDVSFAEHKIMFRFGFAMSSLSGVILHINVPAMREQPMPAWRLP